MAEPQSFKNHTRLVPAYHYFVFPVLTVNFGWEVTDLAGSWALADVVSVLTAAALVVLALYARGFALTAQDRVIRLEMRQRLRELLPASMHPRIGEFTRGQLVALRFAGDTELPALAEKVLRDKIEDKKAIKLLITDWKADHLRV